MSDPVDLLERAASKLEGLASALPEFGGMHGVEGNAAWTDWLDLFIMRPNEVAGSLVEWLRVSAEVYDQDPVPRVGYGPGEKHDSPVLRFARLVLEER